MMDKFHFKIEDGCLDIDSYDCGCVMSKKRTKELYNLIKKYFDKGCSVNDN